MKTNEGTTITTTHSHGLHVEAKNSDGSKKNWIRIQCGCVNALDLDVVDSDTVNVANTVVSVDAYNKFALTVQATAQIFRPQF